MSAARLLSRLDGVRRTGVDRWIAKCPAHDDGRPSLGVRELEDGRTLVHCWASCGTADVLAAVGLEFADLFPERVSTHHARCEQRPFSAIDVLRCTVREALIAAVAAGNLAKGIELSDVDRERLTLAASRLQTAAEMAHA